MNQAKLPVAVLGAGSWGCALGLALARNQHPVRLWDKDGSQIDALNQTPKTSKYLPGITLLPNMSGHQSLEETVAGCDHVVMVVPSHAFGNVLAQLKPLISAKTKLLYATKGLEPKTGRFLHALVAEQLGSDFPVAVLAGPSFAKEVAENLMTAVDIASKAIAHAEAFKALFHSSRFIVRTNADLIGTQIGGVVKNVIAVGCGLAQGLKLGENAKAAMIAWGMTELCALGASLGAKTSTLVGLSGCGDLVLTSTQTMSRNFRYGCYLGEGMSSEAALQKIGQVVEALNNIEELNDLACRQKVAMPVVAKIYSIIKGTLESELAFQQLFS